MTNRTSPALRVHRSGHGREPGTRAQGHHRHGFSSWGRKQASAPGGRPLYKISSSHETSPRVKLPQGKRWRRTIGVGVLEFIGEGLAFSLGQRLDKSQRLKQRLAACSAHGGCGKMHHAHVFAADGVNHIVWRSTQELCDDRKLIDVILSGEQGLSLQHLREDASRTPNVHLHVVLLPCKHDLGGAIVPRRYITGHLWVLDTGKAKVADFQIAVFVDEDVAGFEVAMDNARRVDEFQPSLQAVSERPRKRGFLSGIVTHQNLIQEILNKLFLQRSGGQKSVQVSSQQLGDEVAMAES